MGQTSEQIKQEIDSQRQQLGENLQHLEERVKTTVDWRAQFEQRPMVGIGAAFATGFLLSALMPSGSDSDSGSRSSNRGYGSRGSSQDLSNYRVRDESTSWHQAGMSQQQSSEPSQQSQQSQGFLSFGGGGGGGQKSPEMSEIAETIDSVRGALIGLAATRLRSFLAEAIPGFADEYEQARRSRGSSEATRLSTSSGSSSSSSNSDRETSSGSRSSSATGRSSDSGSTGSSNWQQGSSAIAGESGSASDNPLSDVSRDRSGLNPGPLPTGTTTNRGDDATYRP